jgi:uncharacterized protein (DUF58 family)
VSSPALAADLGLDASLLRSLDRLALRIRRPGPGGGRPGRRAARGAGHSVEFADYRTYSPGDDVRRVDWNVFARSDRLLLRLSVAEEEACVTVIVDCSPSMSFGDPPLKEQSARGLALALVWIAVRSEDRARVGGFGTDVAMLSPTVRGRGGVERLFSAVADLPRLPHSDPAALIACAPHLHPGVTVVVSDFLGEGSWHPALGALRSARQEVVLLQVLALEELEPTLRGDHLLIDVEDGREVEMTITSDTLDAYQRALARHTAELTATAGRHGATLVRLVAGTPLRSLVLGDLRSAGVVH